MLFFSTAHWRQNPSAAGTRCMPAVTPDKPFNPPRGKVAKAHHKLAFLIPFPYQAGPFLTLAPPPYFSLLTLIRADRELWVAGPAQCPVRRAARNCPGPVRTGSVQPRHLWGLAPGAPKPPQAGEARAALAETYLRKTLVAAWGRFCGGRGVVVLHAKRGYVHLWRGLLPVGRPEAPRPQGHPCRDGGQASLRDAAAPQGCPTLGQGHQGTEPQENRRAKRSRKPLGTQHLSLLRGLTHLWANLGWETVIHGENKGSWDRGGGRIHVFTCLCSLIALILWFPCMLAIQMV